MQASVYLAIAPSGERYVGVTSQEPRKRWQLHISTARRGVSGCKRLAAAIVAYGMTEADFKVIGRFPSLDSAKACEREIVAKCKPALNMTKGGDCRPPHTPESKAKIGAAARGNKHNVGRKASAETRARMSASRTGKNFTNAKSKGPRDTSKAVEASAALRRGVPNPAHAEKMRGRKASAETRAKMSASQKARRASEVQS